MAAPVSLRSVLAQPGVARALWSSLLGRLPFTTVGLLLLLHVRDLGGGYARGGLVVAAFSLGLALASPLVGRLVDARGQTVVLVAGALAAPVPLVAIALAPDDSPLAVLVALSGLAGVLEPPLGGCMRALWPVLVRDEDRRHAAYTLEASALEGVFIAGPLLMVGGVAALTSPAAALVATGALGLAGALSFATAAPSRAWRPERVVRRRAAGALASVPVVTLLVVTACMGASFGGIELATTAFADERGQRELVGPLLAAWGLGSLIGGLVFARRGAPGDAILFVARLLAAVAVLNGALALAPNAAALAGLLVLAGVGIAPTFATVYGHVGRVARPGTLTESYTWLTTAITAGVAGGSAVTGVLVSVSSARVGLASTAVLAGVAAAVVGLRRAGLAAPGLR